MANREDVISRLQIIRTWASVRKINERECARMLPWLDDAMKLIEDDDPVAVNDLVQVVRCRDCTHRLRCLISGGHDEDPDWFCADGEAEVQTTIGTEENDGTGEGDEAAQP